MSASPLSSVHKPIGHRDFEHCCFDIFEQIQTNGRKIYAAIGWAPAEHIDDLVHCFI